MSDKTFKIVGDDLSDGYHTFDELYAHRCLLFLAFASSERQLEHTYWVRDHYQDWDLLVTYLNGAQISYHVPAKYRYAYEDFMTEKPESEHQWDGHTPAQVISRLEAYLSNE